MYSGRKSIYENNASSSQNTAPGNQRQSLSSRYSMGPLRSYKSGGSSQGTQALSLPVDGKARNSIAPQLNNTDKRLSLFGYSLCSRPSVM